MRKKTKTEKKRINDTWNEKKTKLTILLLISWKWISQTLSTTSSLWNVTNPKPGTKKKEVTSVWLLAGWSYISVAVSDVICYLSDSLRCTRVYYFKTSIFFLLKRSIRYHHLNWFYKFLYVSYNLSVAN